MRSTDLPKVRALRLFESMTEERFSQLMNAAYLQTFPAQVELITEGQPSDFLYIVMEGSVELFARANGRETVMQMLEPVRSFILAAVLKDAPYLMSARTCTSSRLLMIPSENIRNAFHDDDGFARAIVEELADTYRSAIKEQKNLKLRTAVERLANRLLQFHEENVKSEQSSSSDTFELPYGKRTLASLLGMTPENLSRAFNTLKPYGVEVKGAKIQLTDLPALRALAKENPLIDDPAT